MPELRALAAQLQSLKVYDAFLAKGSFGRNDAKELEAANLYTSLAALKPYSAYGLGIGRDSRGFYTVLAFVHAADASALENVKLLTAKLGAESSLVLKKPWAEVFAIDAAEVRAAGALTWAKLPLRPGVPVSIWTDILFKRDALLLHD